MSTQSLTIASRRLLAGATLLLTALGVGCSPSEASAEASPSAPLADRPLEDYRGQLLELAFDAVSRMPERPHLKNRCRNQAEVVEACLELQQPVRALRYTTRIENWRRGSGYADLAFYSVENGHTDDIRRFLDLAAREAVAQDKDENFQQWRSDEIRSKMARAHLLLGYEEEVDELQGAMERSQTGRLEALRSRLIPAEEFDARLEVLAELADSVHFDEVTSAVIAAAELYGRFYDDVDRREAAAEHIREHLYKLPPQVRLELLQRLADLTLEQGAREASLAFANEAWGVVEGEAWEPEDRIRFLATLIPLRHRSGDPQARKDLDRLLADYDEVRERIVDVFRPPAILAVAEAYHQLGADELAQVTYFQAVEEGYVNLNSRPRAEDLARAALSMARSGFEPDQQLWDRMTEIKDGLEDPW